MMTVRVCVACLILGFLSNVVQAATRSDSDEPRRADVPNGMAPWAGFPPMMGFGPYPQGYAYPDRRWGAYPASSAASRMTFGGWRFGPREHHWSISWGRQPWPAQQQRTPAYSPAPAFGSSSSPSDPQTHSRAQSYQASAIHNQTRIPRVETQISETNPYVQQSVVWTVRLISDANIETISVTVPKTGDAVVEKLDGPVTSVATIGGQQKIVNAFRYVITPLRSGSVPIPSFEASGKLRDRGGYAYGRAAGDQSFSVKADRDLELQVQPPVSTDRRWLPLRSLQINGTLTSRMNTGVGEPLTLKLELSAQGAGGELLPSLASFLKGAGYKVYKEASKVTRAVDPRTNELVGTRSEQYTLIPRRPGKLEIPAIRIPWWDVQHERQQYAMLPSKSVQVAGSPGAGQPVSVAWDQQAIENGNPLPEKRASSWMPLVGGALIVGVVGWWIFFGSRHKTRARQWSQEWGEQLRHSFESGRANPFRSLAPGLAVARQRIRTVMPQGVMGRVSRRAFALVPTPLRIWHCLRRVEAQPDAGSVCAFLQSFVCKLVGLRGQPAPRKMGDTLVASYPSLDPVAVRKVFHELDDALYGSTQFDLVAWKRSFRHSLWPLFYSWSRRSSTAGGKLRLPELNPIH
jgi:hypothetical protein